MGSDDDTPNYAEIQPSEGKRPPDYSYVERRAEIYSLIEKAGHPHNLERSQQDLADRYGVSQRQISKDIERLRQFEADHNTDRAKSVTSWLAEKAVMDAIQDNNFEKALKLQLKYNEFLFDIGELERAAKAVSLEGDAGKAYMEMLRQAHENAKEEGL